MPDECGKCEGLRSVYWDKVRQVEEARACLRHSGLDGQRRTELTVVLDRANAERDTARGAIIQHRIECYFRLGMGKGAP